jgi:hypothetical protein
LENGRYWLVLILTAQLLRLLLLRRELEVDWLVVTIVMTKGIVVMRVKMMTSY